MDLMDLGDMGSGCEEKNCGLALGFSEDCSNQECYWEEPTFELIELVCVTVIYIPLMLFGLLGNILTILVVWLRPYMRSSTYLYLSSMAVSDLLILLLLPLDLYKLWRPRPWPLGDLVCKLTMFLSECCTFCTILHITFLSLERYLAVCWPITAKTVVTRRRTKTVIGCLWLGAAVSAAPVLIMVGVEEVGGEELGLSQWREDGGWTGVDGEQGRIMLGEGERSEHMALMDGGLEQIKWGEKETQRWSERVGELKWFRDEGENKGDVNERKQGDEGEMEDEKQVHVEAGEEERKMEFKGEQQNKKREDEGGGRIGRVDGGVGEEIDRRECRCTHHAVSSGLLSAMMILSNLYFLVPLCILGLVYSLIGRTLWLRPKSSRRDQSHRNTVKMLGVIVLAFVVCWLPFHVGRTIYSFSLGTSTDISHTTEHHVNSDTSSHNLDLSIGSNANTETQNDSADVDTPHGSTDTSTYNFQNWGPTSINPQNGRPNHTDEYSATPYNPFNDDTHNNTYLHPDTHLDFLYYLSQYFNLVSSVLFYLSAAVNPLLYNLMSARYRHAVHSLIHTHTHTQAHHLRSTLTVRHSTTTL